MIVECLAQDKKARVSDAHVLGEQLKRLMTTQTTDAGSDTGTWVGGGDTSTLRDELGPLKQQIEDFLLAEGDISPANFTKLKTMALIADLDDSGLDTLIEMVEAEQQAP